jgi:hypothetical protein
MSHRLGTKMRFFILVILLATISSSFQYSDEFHEELVIKPLKSGHIYNYFQFTTKWDLEKKNDCKYYEKIKSLTMQPAYVKTPLSSSTPL